MRVLVLGAYGMLGHRLLLQMAKNHHVNGTCRAVKVNVPDSFLPRRFLVEGVDANDYSTVSKCIAKVGPDVVMNCIGIVKQSGLAKSPVPSIYINSLFPHLVAEACALGGIRMVHFSTDCVFSGRKGHYDLNDAHDAEDLYGRTKSLGELNANEGVTIRSSIIGREIDSSHGLLEWFIAQRGKRVRGYTNAIFSGLTTHEMANVVESIITKKEISGVHHVASTPISKFDLLELINRALDLNITIEPYPDFHCDRSLDGSRFVKETGYNPPSWKSMVEVMAKDWNAYDELRMGSNEGA